jgi:microcin C transport system ATP-binding protein
MTALNPVFSVGEQIAEVLQIKRGMTREEAWHEAIDLIKVTGIAEPVRRAKSYPHQLSGGQRQRVMIAMALACRPRLLIADEPTTALDVSVRSQILDLLDHLQYRFGMAVLLITHDLEAVRRFADRVLVMEKGLVVEQGEAKEVLTQPQHAYTQKLLNSQPIRDVVVPPADAPVMLQGWGLGVQYPASGGGIKAWFFPKKFTALQDVNFVLRQGHTLGVIGESGSGKTSLALAALGLLPIQGQMKVSGHSWTGNAQVDLPLRRMVQVVFQDPFASLSPRMNVAEIIAEGLAVHMPDLDALGRLRRVLIALSSVGLTEQEFPNLLSRYPHEFSGGQRQRLAIARVLVLDPKVIVLDEPTSALDVTTQKQVLQLLQKLQKQRGLSYLLITHDVDVIRAMAHQVLVVQNAKLVDSGNLDHILQHSTHPYTRLLVNAGYDKK